jgi:hypothetical protein
MLNFFSRNVKEEGNEIYQLSRGRWHDHLKISQVLNELQKIPAHLHLAVKCYFPVFTL